MIIDSVYIDRFRGIKNADINLGDHITLIAGQNGTHKSTLLGIISQTFTIPHGDSHVFSNERPLCGGSYRSTFKEKFRLSPDKDKAGDHQWTLQFKDSSISDHLEDDGTFTVESIPRNKDEIRFWKKSQREQGDGYVHVPVIFLSLKRLIPIAEAGRVKEDDIELTDSEKEWFSEKYNEILLSHDNLIGTHNIVSNNKNTLAVTTDVYDWHSNSSGQDNIGKILLAVLSFKRLKEKYPDDYKGGLLVIDELDATLYPGSQIKLIEVLSSLCGKFRIQLVASTHSLQMLRKVDELKKMRGRASQFSIVYLRKLDGAVSVRDNLSYDEMICDLEVKLGEPVKNKIPVYTEDQECLHFLKALIKTRFEGLDFEKIKLGCEQYISLGTSKVPSFTHPKSIVVLDGDARSSIGKKRLPNYICLPGDKNPETLLANYLHTLPEAHPFWTEKHPQYSKQICFQNHNLRRISQEREYAKEWYNAQLNKKAWGRDAGNLFKHYLETIKDEHKDFLDKFERIYNEAKDHLNP